MHMMHAQRRDLIASRHDLETAGEQFYCFECGKPIPPVNSGHTADVCSACSKIADQQLVALAEYWLAPIYWE